MGKVLPKTKVKPTGVKLLLWGLVVMIVINLMSRFNIIDLTGIQPDVLTLIAILFVSTEMGVFRKRKKFDGLVIFGTVVVILAFLSLVLGWFGLSIAALAPFKGLIDLALLIYVLIAIFT